MNYTPPLTPEQAALLATMPRMPDGTVVSLLYLDNPRQREAMEAQWREWCRAHDRRMWPEWLSQYAKIKSRGKVGARNGG